MTEQNKQAQDEPVIEKVNTPASLTVEELLKMFIEQAKESAKANQELAAAILESRKPYVDPKVVEARIQALKDRAALVEMELRNRQNAKKYCPHLNEGGSSNIKWHMHSNGIILGVCGTCRSEFNASTNREDALLLRQNPKGIRNMARAGDHAKRGVGQIQL